MTAKEKAKELLEKFMQPIDSLHKYPMCFDTAKQCALIAVDELIKQEQKIAKRIHKISFLGNPFIEVVNLGKFWNEVKHEINKSE